MSGVRDKDGRFTRRRALKRIVGTAGAAVALPILSKAVPASPAHSSANLPAPAITTSYVPKFFHANQMETIASLAEMIIPADGHSPGARAALVHEYVDTIVAESFKARKDFWVNGLAAMDKMAAKNFQKQFAECDPGQQLELLNALSTHEGNPLTLEEHFFAAIKNATIEGYYTSAIGIHQELEYQGNTALGEFEGCGHMAHKIESK